MIEVTTQSAPNAVQKRDPASDLNAPTGFRFDRRPITSAASNPGTPTTRTMSRYNSRKALPPFSAVIQGNRQMFPSPIALPTAAKMNPARLAQLSRTILSQGIDSARIRIVYQWHNSIRGDMESDMPNTMLTHLPTDRHDRRIGEG